MATQQFATFYLDDVLWAINILQVREIITNIEVSDVPQSSEHIRGLMNLRGQIVTVVDMAQALGRDTEGKERATCIILKTDSEVSDRVPPGVQLEKIGGDVVGIMVDRMGDVLEIENERIDPSPANITHGEARFVRGVVQLDEELMLILSIESVLNGQEQ